MRQLVTVIFFHEQACQGKAVQFLSLMPTDKEKVSLVRCAYCDACGNYSWNPEPTAFQEQMKIGSKKQEVN